MTGNRAAAILPADCVAAGTVRVLHARKLIQKRESAGLSQSDLARRAGVRQETINRLEKGKNSPDTATIAKITKALRAAGVDN